MLFPLCIGFDWFGFIIIFNFISGTAVIVRITRTRSRQNAAGLGRGVGQSIQKDIHESTRKR